MTSPPGCVIADSHHPKFSSIWLTCNGSRLGCSADKNGLTICRWTTSTTPSVVIVFGYRVSRRWFLALGRFFRAEGEWSQNKRFCQEKRRAKDINGQCPAFVRGASDLR